MTEAGDPATTLAVRATRLTGPARRLHRAVLISFVTTGQAPPAAELDRLARTDGGDPDRVRAELSAADALAFTADGELRAAYPFSPVPTTIQVRWDGGPVVHAMCAIDALGMSAMLGRPVTIAAAEPDTGEPIRVAVDHDRARWTPPGAVVFVGAVGSASCESVDRCCGYMNFFVSSQAARAWASRHPEITGTVLGRHEALRYAISQFGSLLQSPDETRQAG
jgi:Alkylmercury lyase